MTKQKPMTKRSYSANKRLLYLRLQSFVSDRGIIYDQMFGCEYLCFEKF